MTPFTYIVYLHARQTDSASDRCVMDVVQAPTAAEAECLALDRHHVDDPEIITVIRGSHRDAR